MVRRFVAAAALALVSGASGAWAQQPSSPIPLFPSSPPPPYQGDRPPPTVREEALPPIAAPPDSGRPVDRPPFDQPPAAAPPPRMGLTPPPPGPPASPPADAAPAATRIFCNQPVTVNLGDPDRVPDRYRNFVGVWSDAAWTPQLCAALVVENVAPDGTARIVYIFGPMASNVRTAGGVLHGTGIVRDGELRFQNSDGSQFAFRPVYSDFEGRLTTAQGQSYQAFFKKTP